MGTVLRIGATRSSARLLFLIIRRTMLFETSLAGPGPRARSRSSRPEGGVVRSRSRRHDRASRQRRRGPKAPANPATMAHLRAATLSVGRAWHGRSFDVATEGLYHQLVRSGRMARCTAWLDGGRSAATGSLSTEHRFLLGKPAGRPASPRPDDRQCADRARCGAGDQGIRASTMSPIPTPTTPRPTGTVSSARCRIEAPAGAIAARHPRADAPGPDRHRARRVRHRHPPPDLLDRRGRRTGG